ncbi:apolipoprotein N-acyltransferase [Neiella sp. HB171785]|uniref:Apolipoprotein N-acyltransferase n=1 Tax=Neiella litorisoli TaxID=2771431 RepID=A0A8J6QKI3_9GAMM|nr:apolipoprotein N-acyltransferase [Neiella litorisoli]MBD1389757.1 apolipoprotein N-acyltransferase [Neiella litorisoli]
MNKPTTTNHRRWLLMLAAFLFGATYPLAYAPFEHAVVAILAMAGFFNLLKMASSWRQAAATGFAFGFGQFTVGISWVHVSIDSFGGLPLAISLLLMSLLCAYLALFPALTGWLWYRLNNPRWRAFNLLLLPSLWLFGEILRGELLTGFPWLALGYSQTSSWLFAFAPFIGVMGIGWLVACLAVMLSYVTTKRNLYWLTPAFAAVALATYWANLQTVSQPTDKFAQVALVQGNIKQSLKWEPDQQWPTMSKYQDMSRPYYDHDLLIWPEAAIPAIEIQAQSYLQNLDATLAWKGSALVTGIIDYQPYSQVFFNNLIVVGRRDPELDKSSYIYGHNNRYSKHHLLPIGEFVPFGDILRPLAPLFNLPMSSFSRGGYVQHNLEANGWKLAPAICYEILFAEQVRQNVQQDTDFILTVSNDAWFGDSIGPHQHLQIAQMRAKELARPVLRATNNGVTAVIDADGSIMAKAPQFTEAVLTAEVAQHRGQTFFARVGHVPVLALSGLIILIAVWRRWRYK